MRNSLFFYLRPGSIFDPYTLLPLLSRPSPFSWLFTICNQCSITTSTAAVFDLLPPIVAVVFDRNFAFEIRTQRAISAGDVDRETVGFHVSGGMRCTGGVATMGGRNREKQTLRESERKFSTTTPRCA